MPDGSVSSVSLLLVDDDEDDYLITRGMLADQDRLPIKLDWTPEYDAALQLIQRAKHDLYLIDYRLGSHTGLELIRACAQRPQAPIILLTGQGDYQVDLEAAELGVTDYLVKGTLDAPYLERSIRYALRHHRALRDLQLSEERYALAVAAANDGIWDWDIERDEVYYSPRWRALLGHGASTHASTPQDWFELVHPEDLPTLRSEIDAHLSDGSPHFVNEHRIRHADRQWRWVLVRGVATRDAAGHPTRLVGSLSDVTDRHHAEQQLIHGALHDTLTGLPNRALFIDRLSQALARSERNPAARCAVLFVDLDRFKLVNDSLSHAAGDRLLITLARRLNSVLRSGDTVARLGGDEFTILLEDVAHPSDALAMAHRVLNALAEPAWVAGRQLTIMASIGVAQNDMPVDAAELLRNADIAMYDAKRHGGGRCGVFDASMHHRVVSRVALESDLRRALESDQLRVFFQPIIDLGGGELRGFEALARWPPAQRDVPPNEFIPIAEEAGLIAALGAAMLRAACRTLEDWRVRGVVSPDVTVSVNISARQLADVDLVRVVHNALAQTGLPNSCLALELTESTLIDHPERMRDSLEQILSLGVGIHLDDFGTGHSSLTVLHHFPGDTLKIDRSFVTTLAEREESETIIRSIVGLAHNLGLRVIAEGIEDDVQVARLRTLGCELGQGFRFARPLPAHEIESLLARWSDGRLQRELSVRSG